jgi:hypothetical protein
MPPSLGNVWRARRDLRRMLPARMEDDGPALLRLGGQGAFARLAGYFLPAPQA